MKSSATSTNKNDMFDGKTRIRAEQTKGSSVTKKDNVQVLNKARYRNDHEKK